MTNPYEPQNGQGMPGGQPSANPPFDAGQPGAYGQPSANPVYDPAAQPGPYGQPSANPVSQPSANPAFGYDTTAAAGYGAQPGYDATGYGQQAYDPNAYGGQQAYDPNAYGGQQAYDPNAYAGQAAYGAQPGYDAGYAQNFNGQPPMNGATPVGPNKGGVPVWAWILAGVLALALAIGAWFLFKPKDDEPVDDPTPTQVDTPTASPTDSPTVVPTGSESPSATDSPSPVPTTSSTSSGSVDWTGATAKVAPVPFGTKTWDKVASLPETIGDWKSYSGMTTTTSGSYSTKSISYSNRNSGDFQMVMVQISKNGEYNNFESNVKRLDDEHSLMGGKLTCGVSSVTSDFLYCYGKLADSYVEFSQLSAKDVKAVEAIAKELEKSLK